MQHSCINIYNMLIMQKNFWVKKGSIRWVMKAKDFHSYFFMYKHIIFWLIWCMNLTYFFFIETSEVVLSFNKLKMFHLLINFTLWFGKIIKILQLPTPPPLFPENGLNVHVIMPCNVNSYSTRSVIAWAPDVICIEKDKKKGEKYWEAKI